jgi:hypothetical protein
MLFEMLSRGLLAIGQTVAAEGSFVVFWKKKAPSPEQKG